MSMNLWKIEQLCKENFALGAASRDAEIAELVSALEWVRKVTVDIEMHDAIDFTLAKVRKP